jgi:hypothetical protein
VQPVPELFHADALVWKRRSPALRALLATWRGSEPDAAARLRAAIVADAPELAPHVDTMWQTWLPRVRACVDADEPGFAIERDLPLDVRVACERVFERVVWIARDALEPHRLHGAEPRVPHMPNLRYHLAVSLLVLDGLDATIAMLARPADAVGRIASATKERTLALVTATRPRHVEATVHAFRWVLGNELTGPQAGQRAPSILEYFDLLAARTPRDEEWRPRATQSSDGAWRVDLP